MVEGLAAVADVDDLLARLAHGLARGTGAGLPLPDRLCRAACGTLGCDGGAITIAYTRPERVTLCTTDDTAPAARGGPGRHRPGPRAGRLHLGGLRAVRPCSTSTGPTLGGPCSSRDSLTALAPRGRPRAADGRGRDRVIGVLTLYQRGPDREIDLDAAVIVARVVAAALLADGPSMQEAGHGPWSERAEVHQATGMVVAQLGIPEDRRARAAARLRLLARPERRPSRRTPSSPELAFSANPDQEIEST